MPPIGSATAATDTCRPGRRMDLTLRPVSAAELAVWLDTGRQPFDDGDISWHPDYPTADTADAIRMLQLRGDGAPPWGIWQMVHQGQVIGDVGFHGPPDADGAVEIGYQVVPVWRRRGAASTAVGLIVAEAVRHGARSVRADVVGDNQGSSQSLQRNGFHVLARHGDTMVWGRSLGTARDG